MMKFFPIFSSKMVSSSCLSMIDFMLIFVSGIRKWSNFIYLLVFIQVPQQHLFKQLSFSQWIFLAPLSNICWLHIYGFISWVLILLHWPIVCFYATAILFWLLWFYNILWSPGEGNGYPLQYSELENSIDCIVHGVTRSQTWVSNFHVHFHSEKKEQSERCYTSISNYSIKLGKLNSMTLATKTDKWIIGTEYRAQK